MEDQRPTRYAAERALAAGHEINAVIMKDAELSFTVSPEVQAAEPRWVARTVTMQFSHIENELKRIFHSQIEQAYLDGIDAVEGQIVSTLHSFKENKNYNDEAEYRKHRSAVRLATDYLKQCS